MGEFWKKHKIAILITGGIFLFLYLFYKYEQQQASANSTSAQDLASQLAATSLPLVYGGGASSPISGDGSSIPLQNFVNPPGVTTQAPGTSASGVPSNAPGNAGYTGPVIPTPATTPPSASGYLTNPAAQTTAAAQETAMVKAQIIAGTCQYQIGSGGSNPGLPICGPSGQFSAPYVSGLLPGQAGYTSALESEIYAAQQASPNAVAGLEALLAQYGGFDATISEHPSTPAGGNQTAAPVTAPPATPVQPARPPVTATNIGSPGQGLPAGKRPTPPTGGQSAGSAGSNIPPAPGFTGVQITPTAGQAGPGNTNTALKPIPANTVFGGIQGLVPT